MITNLKDLKEITEIIQTLNIYLSKNIVIVFSLIDKQIIGIYDYRSWVPNDEPNNKYFKLKGREISKILNYSMNLNSHPSNLIPQIQSQLDTLKDLNLEFSENAFGYIIFKAITTY